MKPLTPESRMHNFTPFSALIGGAMIGTATALFLVLNGRIAGISGILGGLLPPARGDVAWRLAFLIGIVAAPLLYAAVGGHLPPIGITGSAGVLVGAGLLVGFGTRLGSGCTSGHGVCGIGRGSPRSMVATLTFMLVAAVTVFVTHHMIGA
jgi:uncharacterized membrane protein YedE/YeeE